MLFVSVEKWLCQKSVIFSRRLRSWLTITPIHHFLKELRRWLSMAPSVLGSLTQVVPWAILVSGLRALVEGVYSFTGGGGEVVVGVSSWVMVAARVFVLK